MLAVELFLLTGRYVATAYNDRASSEWPPHPARLFSALVEAHYSEDPADPAERRALEWLEQQGPPSITASNIGDETPLGRDIVTVFVPVNDTTLIGDFEKFRESVEAARAALEQARAALAAASSDPVKPDRKGLERKVARAEAEFAKRNSRLQESLVCAATDISKLSRADNVAAARLLPEGRNRQPRTFPSITPDDPVVVFTWPRAKPDAATREGLQRIAARVVRVGHPSSLVRVRLLEDAPEPSLVPDDTSPTRLRVVGPAQLERLNREFSVHQETQPRVLPFIPQGYRSAGTRAQKQVQSSVFEDEDWLVFEILAPERRQALPMIRAADAARAVRGALLEHANEPLPELLTGHGPDGGPSLAPHLAIFPLPWVETPHSDGRLLGIALVLPRGTSREDRRNLFQTVDRWERAIRAQSGEEADAPRLPLGIKGAAGFELRRLDEVPRLKSLRASGWCRPARVWASATPVALDRHPGDLRARDPGKAAAAFAEAERSLAAACTNIGLPKPRRVVATRSALLAGCEKVRRFPRFPSDPGRIQRVLVHALLEFEHDVRGPVALGAGRFFGLGLFRPLDITLEEPTGGHSGKHSSLKEDPLLRHESAEH